MSASTKTTIALCVKSAKATSQIQIGTEMNETLCSDGCVPAPQYGDGWIEAGSERGCPGCGATLFSSLHNLIPGQQIMVQHGDSPEHRREFAARNSWEFDRSQLDWFDEIHALVEEKTT